MRGKDRIQSLNRKIREFETVIDWWKSKWEASQFEVTQLTATLDAQKKANLIEATRRNKEIMDEAISQGQRRVHRSASQGHRSQIHERSPQDDAVRPGQSMGRRPYRGECFRRWPLGCDCSHRPHLRIVRSVL